jgi:hypothetical protein
MTTLSEALRAGPGKAEQRAAEAIADGDPEGAEGAMANARQMRRPPPPAARRYRSDRVTSSSLTMCSREPFPARRDGGMLRAAAGGQGVGGTDLPALPCPRHAAQASTEQAKGASR